MTCFIVYTENTFNLGMHKCVLLISIDSCNFVHLLKIGKFKINGNTCARNSSSNNYCIVYTHTHFCKWKINKINDLYTGVAVCKSREGGRGVFSYLWFSRRRRASECQIRRNSRCLARDAITFFNKFNDNWQCERNIH